jgi:hypothetical protein
MTIMDKVPCILFLGASYDDGRESGTVQKTGVRRFGYVSQIPKRDEVPEYKVIPSAVGRMEATGLV